MLRQDRHPNTRARTSPATLLILDFSPLSSTLACVCTQVHGLISNGTLGGCQPCILAYLSVCLGWLLRALRTTIEQRQPQGLCVWCVCYRYLCVSLVSCVDVCACLFQTMLVVGCA